MATKKTESTQAPKKATLKADVVDPTPVLVEAPSGSRGGTLVPPGSVTPAGDVHRRRTDDDVLTAEFADVVSGPEAGKRVSFQRTVSVGKDGYPDDVIVRTRDNRDEMLTVKYRDLRPAPSGGR